MTNELTLLTKENFGSIELDFYRNTENEIFMTSKQLGEALHYSDKKSIEKIVERNDYLKNKEFSVTVRLSATDGKSYNTRVFTEDGIYEVTMLSKQPKAREFRAFVRKLLKGLRKNEIKIIETSPSYLIEDPITRAEQWILEQKEKRALEHTVTQYEPKVQYYHKVLQSDNNLMTVTQIAKDYGMHAMALNKLLHELKIQFKHNNQWLLYSEYQNKGYTKSVTSLDPSGKSGTEGAVHVYTKWTQKGRKFIHDTLAKKGIMPID